MARYFLGGGVNSFLTGGDVTFMDGLVSGTWMIYMRPNWSACQSNADIIRKDGCWTPWQRSSANSYPRTAFWTPAGAITTYDNTGYTWTTGAWHWSACVYDFNHTFQASRLTTWAALPRTRIAVAGSSDLTTSYTSIRDVSNPLFVGRRESLNQEHFDGDLAHMTFWAAALSRRELQALADGAHPYSIRRERLRFYLPLGTPREVDLVGAVQMDQSTQDLSGSYVSEAPRLKPILGPRPRFLAAPSAPASAIKTVLGLSKASVKTVMGVPIANVKTINGLA